MAIKKIGVLLTNIGSPDQPTSSAVRRYLKKFLSDPRVVEIPKLLWWPILYGLILPLRAKKSAKLYQQIWTNQGSPLVHLSTQIATQLQEQLQFPVAIGMHYGNPSIKAGLLKLRAQQVDKILILPMYPQYSATSTAVTFDQVAAELKHWRKLPEIQLIHDYAEDAGYIDALYHSIQKHPVKHLLFSFHGIPKRCIDLGDPYYEQCQKTVKLLTQKLNLTADQYSVAFQSRVGRAKWLTPYTDQVLRELPKKGITDLHVICPGFAVDCLETLEEIAIRGQEQFLNAGGKAFHYIPALNTENAHLETLKNIIKKALSPSSSS